MSIKKTKEAIRNSISFLDIPLDIQKYIISYITIVPFYDKNLLISANEKEKNENRNGYGLYVENENDINRYFMPLYRKDTDDYKAIMYNYGFRMNVAFPLVCKHLNMLFREHKRCLIMKNEERSLHIVFRSFMYDINRNTSHLIRRSSCVFFKWSLKNNKLEKTTENSLSCEEAIDKTSDLSNSTYIYLFYEYKKKEHFQSILSYYPVLDKKEDSLSNVIYGRFLRYDSRTFIVDTSYVNSDIMISFPIDDILGDINVFFSFKSYIRASVYSTYYVYKKKVLDFPRLKHEYDIEKDSSLFLKMLDLNRPYANEEYNGMHIVFSFKHNLFLTDIVDHIHELPCDVQLDQSLMTSKDDFL